MKKIVFEAFTDKSRKKRNRAKLKLMLISAGVAVAGMIGYNLGKDLYALGQKGFTLGQQIKDWINSPTLTPRQKEMLNIVSEYFSDIELVDGINLAELLTAAQSEIAKYKELDSTAQEDFLEGYFNELGITADSHDDEDADYECSDMEDVSVDSDSEDAPEDDGPSRKKARNS